ncbi:MAG: radical SAM protein [Pirellulaceae bacterium]
MSSSGGRKQFVVEVIKPSHYDDDGYVIQWVRAYVPSNSLACLFGLLEDARSRKVLGEDVDISLNGYDECHTIIPVKNIIKRIKAADGGLVMLAGVQTNQFPRALELAREFRQAGIQVAIGGFHISGCIAMLPELPADIQEMKDLGVSLFAGEAEGRMEQVLQAAFEQRLEPVYNYMLDLPDLQGQVTPYLPPEIAKGYLHFTPFDVGRGCPFLCSFCTIINVQGRKSRYRDADDVEKLVRDYHGRGVNRFFITDDNMARNKNWEAIFDRLIKLREEEGIGIKFLIQVDTLCHRIPGFIEKATRAGCNRVFIGLENINPDNLEAANKKQNRITEYRQMLQDWRNRGTVTYAGYILGLPADTPESIERDLRVIQEELPVDILEFMILTPLPGSADHRNLAAAGEWMDPDMNKYDLEHVTQKHGKMTPDEWSDIYDRAWHLYYSDEHIETLLRRAEASGAGAKRMSRAILQFYGSYKYDGVHPLQGGILRRKVRTLRRPGMKRVNPLLFYPARLWETVRNHVSLGLFFLRIDKLRKRVEREQQITPYTDAALAPVEAEADEALQIFSITDAAQAAAAKAKSKKQRVSLPVVDASCGGERRAA